MGKVLFFAVALLSAISSTCATRSLHKRDDSTFLNTLPTLASAASTFAGDQYNAGVSTGTTLNPVETAQLTVISNDLKNLSDAFDNSYIQLAQLFTPFTFKLSTSDAATVNSTIPSIQSTILNHLTSLSDSETFFEDVNSNENWLLTLCHRVQILALEHGNLLELLATLAPSSDYSSFWSSLATTASADYGFAILSTESGFNCPQTS